MTEKILDYRTVSGSNIAKIVVEYFKEKYHIGYSWGDSYGEIKNAVAVCVLEVDSSNRYVTTTKSMGYIERRQVVKSINLGEL